MPMAWINSRIYPSFSKSGPKIIFVKLFPYFLHVIPNNALCPKRKTQSEMSHHTFRRFMCLDTHFERSAGAVFTPLLTALITSKFSCLLTLYSSVSYTTRFDIQKCYVMSSQCVGVCCVALGTKNVYFPVQQ